MSEPYTRVGVPAIGESGRAASELPAGRPPLTDGADHELSAASFPERGVEVRAGSVRGLLHRYREQPRQDRFSLAYDERSETLLVTVCDGVGSLPRSHEAAAFVARHMPAAYLAHGEWPEAILDVNQRLSAYVRESTPDAAMATTFVGVAVDLGAAEPTASIAWTDDSTVWRLDGPEWTELTVADPSPDGKLHSTSVRALPHDRPRFHTARVPVHGGAIFVMTDGVGVPLAGASEVRDTLAGWWAAPPDEFTFGRQVGFARKSHLDDRTVVGIWFGVEPR